MSDERAVSKVVLNGKTLIDITNSTVTNENLLDGEIATGANGRGVVGGIPINTSANLTTSGATVRVPAGYYAEQVSKTIASGSVTTPSTEITANPSITVSNSGLITASAAANESITPTVVAGYVTAGTAGTVTVSGSNTKQLDASSVVGGTTTISGTTATRAKATWNRGWIQAGELAAATFANSATSGKTYVDISNTTAAPILVSGNYLYINAGYTDNLKISLAKLVPDGASVDLAEDKMLSGYSAYNNNGQLITGNIPTKTNSDLTVNGAIVNVPAGYYATNVSKTISSGSATISGSITTTPTISVSNSGLITASINGSIGLTPTVDAGYITEGTTGTVSYSGSKTQQLTTKAATTFNTSASDQSIAAGTYLTGKQTIKAVTTANISAENIKDGIVVKVGDANNAGRIKNVTGTFTDSSTVSSGQTAATTGQILSGYSAWVDGEEVKGNIATVDLASPTIDGSDLPNSGTIYATITQPSGYSAGGTKTVSYDIPVQGAKTITPSESEQIAVAAGRYTLDPVKVAAISHTYVGSGITQKDAATYYPSTSDQYINSNTYLSGIQTIKAVTHTATAAKIASGQVIKIGDSVDNDRITSITGTYTNDATLNNNNQMLKNVTAYSKGTKYTGSIETKTASNLIASGKTVTVPAGYYATQVTKDVASGSATTPATTITVNPTISVDTTTGEITATTSASKSITPTVSAGYVSTGTAGTVTVNGSGTSQIDVYEGEIGEGNNNSNNIIANQRAVNFIDYDGTILYSYTAAQFINLTALPENPSHNGLIAQGWNWSLADAKAYVIKYGKLQIGQMYITDDGKTRVYVHLEESRSSPVLGCCPNGTVVIDWGDNSATETLTGTSLTTLVWTNTHNYATAGDYVITLNVTSGTIALMGENNSATWSGLLRYASSEATPSDFPENQNIAYQNSIQRIEIGTNVSIIGDYAFRNCYSLVNITIPNSVTEIGSEPFYDCNGLISIVIPNSVTNIGRITSTSSGLGGAVFYNCYSLINIALPNNITSIDERTFQNCYSLTNVTLPDSITSIGDYTFINCYSLTNVIIPDSITSIGNYVFDGCYNLTNITIPNGITRIGNYTFTYCYNLTNITIPDSITSIGNNAFQNCYNLTNVTIPDSITSIGDQAFRNCKKLTNIIIPDNITQIKSYTFSGCRTLINIIIPNNVTEIGAQAFYYCYSLAKIRFESTTPPTVANSNAWSNIPKDCIISIPIGTLSAYTSATNYPDPTAYTYIEE